MRRPPRSTRPRTWNAPADWCRRCNRSRSYAGVAGRDAMRLPASRRAMAAVADQAISSGTNFLTSLIAMWLLGPRQFGGLTLALALGDLVLGGARAGIGDPLPAHAPPPTARGRPDGKT